MIEIKNGSLKVAGEKPTIMSEFIILVRELLDSGVTVDEIKDSIELAQIRGTKLDDLVKEHLAHMKEMLTSFPPFMTVIINERYKGIILKNSEDLPCGNCNKKNDCHFYELLDKLKNDKINFIEFFEETLISDIGCSTDDKESSFGKIFGDILKDED